MHNTVGTEQRQVSVPKCVDGTDIVDFSVFPAQITDAVIVLSPVSAGDARWVVRQSGLHASGALSAFGRVRW